MKGKGHKVTARNRAAGDPDEIARPLTTDEWDNVMLFEYEGCNQDTSGDKQGVH